MQLRKPWTGTHGELHGMWIDDTLTIEYRARRGKRSIRLIPLDTTRVKVVSVLPDGLMSETIFEKSSPHLVE